MKIPLNSTDISVWNDELVFDFIVEFTALLLTSQIFRKMLQNTCWNKTLNEVPYSANLIDISVKFIDKYFTSTEKTVNSTDKSVTFTEILCCHYFNLSI